MEVFTVAAAPAEQQALSDWVPQARPTPWIRREGPVVILAVVVVVLAAVYASLPDGQVSQSWAVRMPVVATQGMDMPTPVMAPSGRPLGFPQRMPAVPGPYAFMALQPSSDEPIAYDPCRRIPYVVNLRNAPPGAEKLVRDSVEVISEITGLQFAYEGTTDEPVSAGRDIFQPDRYGDRWAPVLIAWSDPGEMPELAGDVAGVGGSIPVETSEGTAVYVTGMVALDGPSFTRYYRSVSGRLASKGIVLHELGHLVGLAHVDDRSQLMDDTSGTVDPQSGDIAGLVQLGSGPCVARL